VPEPLVLAIEPDLRQAAIVKRIVREKALAEVAVVDSIDAAMAAIRTSMPDVLLLSALLSPRDEDLLIAHLRTLDHASHVQTHTIPQLASTLEPGEAKASRGLLSAFRRKKSAEPVASGCDPDLFAEEIRVFLQHAAQKKHEVLNGDRIVPQVRTEAAETRPPVAPSEAAGEPESAWSSPFEWKPTGSDRSTPAAAAPPAPERQVKTDSKTTAEPQIAFEPQITTGPQFASEPQITSELQIKDTPAFTAFAAPPAPEPIPDPPAFDRVAAEPAVAELPVAEPAAGDPFSVEPLAAEPQFAPEMPSVVDAPAVTAFDEQIHARPSEFDPLVLDVAASKPRAAARPRDAWTAGPSDAQLAAAAHLADSIEIVEEDTTEAEAVAAASVEQEIVIDLDAPSPSAPAPRRRKPADARAVQDETSSETEMVAAATIDRNEWTSDLRPSDGRASDRLGPLARWARVEPRKTKDAPVGADDVRALIASLSVPDSVAWVSYARGCRIRRVRVPPAAESDPADSLGAVILSRRALAEQREKRPTAG
jgi:hypothetical protein